MAVNRGYMEKIEFLQQKLLTWYRDHMRELPWRKTKDAYAVWISEIMLQQTQVRTVIPYYERFIERFPSVTELANSDMEEVLRYWAGLGYYSRARNLHAAAREIVEKHKGVFPGELKDVIALPGIGRYTAGAILSIACDLPVPILDGNVIRVLSRVFMVRGDTETTPVKAHLWSLAELVVPGENAGDFNQAMMELGALICTPFEPDCPECPIMTICQARKAGVQNQYPETGKRTKTQRVREVAIIIERDGRFLIARRVPEGLWGGLWEFPRGRCVEGESLEDCQIRIAEDTIGVRIRTGPLAARIKHSVMHYSIVLHAFRVEIVSGEPKAVDYAEVRWALPDDFSKLPFSAPQARVAQVVSEQKALEFD